jgi:hypothetical protein
LKWPKLTDTRLKLDIKQFETTDENADKRVNVQLFVNDDRHLEVAGGPIDGNRATTWLRTGDKIRSEDWELSLDTIVEADPANKNPGWAGFTVSQRL